MACAAALVPHVLGTAGQALDVGRVARLFTRAQRRALLRRDRGCTYPGCTAPAAWTQAHHVVHWLDGGATDLDNAALLCQRHHTIVHERRYVAQVREAPDEAGRFVVWDRTHGSYDRHLERLRAERGVADPRPLTPAQVAQLVAAIQADDPDDPGGRTGPRSSSTTTATNTNNGDNPWNGPSFEDPCTAEHREASDGPCHHQEWATRATRIPLPR